MAASDAAAREPVPRIYGHRLVRYLLAMLDRKPWASIATLCTSLALLVGCAASTAPAQTSTVTDTGATSAAHRPAAARMQGLYSYLADAGTFVDCATGQRLPVAQAGDNAALERAYTAARPTPGATLLAVVDGRVEVRPPMEGPARPTLVVERFVSIADATCDGDPPSTAVLEDTYWKLVRLGATPITVVDPQREPHFVLQPQGARVVGSGGCNRLAGSYTLVGDKLAFGQLAGTRMACPDGMDIERAFHAALGEVASWRINGDMLELLDAAGVSIAQFESRQLD